MPMMMPGMMPSVMNGMMPMMPGMMPMMMGMRPMMCPMTMDMSKDGMVCKMVPMDPAQMEIDEGLLRNDERNDDHGHAGDDDARRDADDDVHEVSITRRSAPGRVDPLWTVCSGTAQGDPFRRVHAQPCMTSLLPVVVGLPAVMGDHSVGR